MNARILELIKNPELIQSQDLSTLNSEIKNTPYAQSIRALYLYGIHKLQPESYRDELSETAAYTTDKKILYQLINKTKVEQETRIEPVKVEESKPEIIAETVAEPVVAEKPNAFTNGPVIEKPDFEPVFVNGELNRILFKGEEDFLDKPAPAIDIEQTKETGVIITQSPAIAEIKKEEIQSAEEEIPAEEELEIEPKKEAEIIEEIIEEKVEVPPIFEPEIEPEPEVEELSQYQEVITDDISEVKDEKSEDLTAEVPANDEDTAEQKPSEVSSAVVNFHGTAEFLPEVKLSATPSAPEQYEVPKATVNKHELEMQRLIAEVEAKMKYRKKSSGSDEEETLPSTSLDFSETMEIGTSDSTETSNLEKNPDTVNEDLVETQVENMASEPEVVEDTDSSREWKPMSFETKSSESFSRKYTLQELNQQVTEETKEIEDFKDLKVEAPEEEKPAFNISFFTQNVTSIETETAAELISDLKEHIEPEKEVSNVPVFINTWENWLKIDRSANQSPEEIAAAKAEEKNKVIESFITKEPKISKLREETDFVVKERGDNISHLMTETLAKLYAEQKLYSKAIKAYETLTQKYPERSEYFAEQIQQIKDLRQNK